MKKILFLLVFCWYGVTLMAQLDTSFWFAAPNQNTGFQLPIFIRVNGGKNPSVVTISQPANPTFTPIVLNVPANGFSFVDVSDFLSVLANSEIDEVTNKGILISATNSISAYYEVSKDNNPDLFSLKGRNALGTNFVVTSIVNNWPNDYQEGGAFYVVATADNTIVTITPSVDLVGHPKEEGPFTVTLNKGEVYSARSVLVDNNALTNVGGTIVTANKPVAVTMANDFMGTPSGCRDINGDQMVPVTLAGNEFITLPGALEVSGGTISDLVFVFATEDGTTVHVNGSQVAILNMGDFHEIVSNNATQYITSDKSVLVYQLGGFGCEVGGAVIPQIACTGSTAVSIQRSTAENCFINLLAKSGTEQFFTYNGDPGIITASLFNTVPNTNGEWRWARVEFNSTLLPAGGGAIIRNKLPFHLGFINGSPGGGTRYGYFSNFGSFEPSVFTGLDEEEGQYAYTDIDAISYQWYYSPDPTVIFQPVAGGTSDTLFTPLSGYFYVAVTYDENCEPAISETVFLPDCDDDGLSNALEIALGLDPCNSDTDGDGIPDNEECIGTVIPEQFATTFEVTLSIKEGTTPVNYSPPTTNYADPIIQYDYATGKASFTTSTSGSFGGSPNNVFIYPAGAYGDLSEITVKATTAPGELITNFNLGYSTDSTDDGYHIEVNDVVVLSFNYLDYFEVPEFGAQALFDVNNDGIWTPRINEGNPQIELDVVAKTIRLMLNDRNGGRQDAIPYLKAAGKGTFNPFPYVDLETGVKIGSTFSDANGMGPIGIQTISFEADVRTHCDLDGDGVFDFLDPCAPILCCSFAESAGQIAGAQTICPNTAATAFTSVAAASGQTGELQYRWQQSPTNSPADFIDIPDADGETYSPSTLSETTWFRRLAGVDCFEDWSEAPASNMIMVTVEDLIPPTVTCSNTTIRFNGETSIPVTASDIVTASDNCAVGNTTLMPSSISCQQLGQVIPMQVMVADVNGNVNGCVSQVTVRGLPCGWRHNSGSVGTCTSDIDYNAATGVWNASATNCRYGSPFTSDRLMFAQYQLCGDGSITAQVTGLDGAQPFAGITMRESNDPGSKKVQLMINRISNILRREVRTTTGAQCFPTEFPSPCERTWLRIVRTGNMFRGYTSQDGQTWWYVMQVHVPMNSCIEIGLVLTNMQMNVQGNATFANVTVTGGQQGPVAMSPGIEQAQEDAALLDVRAYPNPVAGELQVDLSAYAGRRVAMALYDIQGQLLMYREIAEVGVETEQLDMGNLPAGVYQLQVRSAGLPLRNLRVVVQR
jgi:hypothetical protein